MRRTEYCAKNTKGRASHIAGVGSDKETRGTKQAAQIQQSDSH